MDDDIVARLRPYTERHRVECECFACRAVHEIERLRELSGDAGKLREERDEARAEVRRLRSSVCLGAPSSTTVGWSCFKEATDGSR